MRARGLLFIALTLGFLSPALPAAPAGGAGVDFVVTPSQLEIQVEPGESAWASVRIYNRQKTPLDLRAYIRDVELPKSDLIGGGDIAFSASRWISFRTAGVEVPAGGVTDAVLQVRVPRSAAPGGYHAFGYLESDATSATGGTGVAVSGRIGVTLLLDVVPAGAVLDRSARLSALDVAVHWDGLFRADIETSATLENTGDTHVLVGGVHTYRGWPGNGTAQKKVGPYTLLRGTRHTLTSSWVGPLIGRVTVTTEIVYQRGPDDLPAIVMQRTVWIVPWHLIAPLVIVLALAGLVWARRRRRRHAPRHAPGRQRTPAPERRPAVAATSSRGGRK